MDNKEHITFLRGFLGSGGCKVSSVVVDVVVEDVGGGRNAMAPSDSSSSLKYVAC